MYQVAPRQPVAAPQASKQESKDGCMELERSMNCPDCGRIDVEQIARKLTPPWEIYDELLTKGQPAVSTITVDGGEGADEEVRCDLDELAIYVLHQLMYFECENLHSNCTRNSSPNTTSKTKANDDQHNRRYETEHSPRTYLLWLIRHGIIVNNLRFSREVPCTFPITDRAQPALSGTVTSFERGAELRGRRR